MPLDRGSIKAGQRLKARWLTDLYDLLSGTITDTDVFLGRNLTVRGALSTVGSVSQVAPGPTNVPMTLYGAAGQTANLLEARDNLGNLLFAVGPAGTINPFRASDFTNATHNHTSAAQGGTLAPAIIPSLESLYAGSWTTTSTNYTVAAAISIVFVTASCTITLGAASSTNRPVTVVTVAGTATVAAASGSVIGGSVNTSTGAIMNGTVSAGDSVTYKSDGTNWRAV